MQNLKCPSLGFQRVGRGLSRRRSWSGFRSADLTIRGGGRAGLWRWLICSYQGISRLRLHIQLGRLGLNLNHLTGAGASGCSRRSKLLLCFWGILHPSGYLKGIGILLLKLIGLPGAVGQRAVNSRSTKIFGQLSLLRRLAPVLSWSRTHFCRRLGSFLIYAPFILENRCSHGLIAVDRSRRG